MTFKEALAIGESKLIEHQTRLKAKVKGTKPYNPSTVRHILKHYQDELPPPPEMVMLMIDGVLDQLAAETSFWMSEPAVDDSLHVTTLKHNDLRLTLVSTYDVNTNLQHWKVQCWYYGAVSN